MKWIVLLLMFVLNGYGYVVENIAVLDLRGRGVSESDLEIVRMMLESNLSMYGDRVGNFRVMDRQGVDIFKEQRLQLSGGVNQVLEVGRVMGLHGAVTGVVGTVDSLVWFYSLKLVDMETGAMERSCYVEFSGGYSGFVRGARIAVERLYGGDRNHIDKGSSSFKEEEKPSVQLLMKKRVVDVHHYHHSGTEKAGFVPCSYCRGVGEYMDGNVKRDCPYCSVTSKYSGPETHGRFMTGKWVR